MFKSLLNALIAWNQETNEREKLQHTYISLSVISLFVAGIVSLIDHQTGEDLLMITAAAAAIFFTNGVIWSLLQNAVSSKLSGRRRSK